MLGTVRRYVAGNLPLTVRERLRTSGAVLPVALRFCVTASLPKWGGQRDSNPRLPILCSSAFLRGEADAVRDRIANDAGGIPGATSNLYFSHGRVP